MLKAKKIRLDVSASDAATLEFMQGKCRGLYNWLVMRLRAGERWHFAAEKARLSACRAYDPELDAVYGKLLAEVYFRLDAAMQAFFRRLKQGETPGFPRVRPRHQFFTLCYPAAYLRFEGKRLILPTGGKEGHKHFPNVVATLAEVPPCGFREVAISRDARGHYYASFVYAAPEAEPQPAEPQSGQVVAFEPPDQDAGDRRERAGALLSHRGGQRPSVVQQTTGQDPLQAGPLQKEVETV